jgi:hypothetical protein
VIEYGAITEGSPEGSEEAEEQKEMIRLCAKEQRDLGAPFVLSPECTGFGGRFEGNMFRTHQQ